MVGSKKNSHLTPFGQDLDALLELAKDISSISQYAEEADVNYKYISQLRNDPNRRPGRNYVLMLVPFVKRKLISPIEAQQFSWKHRAKALSRNECKILFPGMTVQQFLNLVDRPLETTTAKIDWGEAASKLPPLG